MTDERKGKIKRHYGAKHIVSFYWWAITGLNWFRREHVLKERE